MEVWMRYSPSYSSRFRILKGGKISLVVSALLVSSAMIGTDAFATTVVSSDSTTAIDDDVVTVNAGKTLNVTETQTSGNVDIYAISSTGTANITNNGNIRVTSEITAGDSSSYSTATGVIVDNTGAIVNNGLISVNSNANSTVTDAYNATATGIGVGGEATITNYGTIEAKVNGNLDTNGYAIDTDPSGAAYITNKSTGILKGNVYIANGTLRNEGQIISPDEGVQANNLDGTRSIVNASGATITTTATADFATGIQLNGNSTGSMTDTSLISNAGRITVSNTTGSVAVIDLVSMYDNSTITNASGATLRGSSENANADGIVVGDMYNNAQINNAGTIYLTTNNNAVETSVGIGVGTLNNSASIINNGTITMTMQGTSDAVGLGVTNMYDDSSVTNNSTVNISNTNGVAIGIGVAENLYDNTSIVNTGTIQASSESSEAFGMQIASMQNTSSISNSGTISANTNSAVTIDNSHGIIVDSMAGASSINNSGTIKATVNNEYDARGSSIVVIDSSSVASDTPSITNTSTGKLYGNIYIGGDATFNNAGLVSLPYNANAVDAEHQPYIANFTNTGTLEIGAKKTSGVITNSQLLTDNTTFNNGSTMQVKVVAGSQAFHVGDRLSDVVTATNSLTINNLAVGRTITDTSALLNFTYETGTNSAGDKIDLVVSQETALTDAVSGNGGKNTSAAAQALVSSANVESMSSVMSAFQSLSTNNEIVKAVQSLTPTTTTATVGAASQISTGISGIVSTRQNTSTGGMNSGDVVFGEKNLWVKTYGSTGNQNNKDGMNGFGVKSYGLGIGVDGEYKANQKAGLAMFYTRAKVDVNNVNQKSDMDVISAIAYGSNLLPDTLTTLAYQLGYSWQKTSSNRQVFTGETASADYTSTTTSLDMKLSRSYALNDKITVQPNVGTTYRYFNNPSYSESGAGALNLHSDHFTSTELLGNFGADVSYKFDNRSKIVANVGAGYNFRDTTATVTSAFDGASSVKFSSDGIDNGRWRYEAGLGYDARINEASNINVSYNYQAQGSDFTNNVLSAKYEHKF